MPVFGLLKRNGKVYTRIVEDVSRKTLRRIIRTKVVPESVIYTYSFRSYDGLVLDVGGLLRSGAGAAGGLSAN